MINVGNSSILADLLNEKYFQFNRPDFIDGDPVCIPHRFNRKENIEIAGFFSATLAWGQRKVIIRNAERLMNAMENEPYNFVMDASDNEIHMLQSFVHRTFQFADLQYFILALRYINQVYGGIHKIFSDSYLSGGDLKLCLQKFYDLFFGLPHLQRTRKHISDVANGSAAKRMNMFLRWMIRTDSSGIDFGIWNDIPPSALYIPLDVHTAKVARHLGLLKRNQNDWKAVEELTAELRKFDPYDPVKYDYALFGMGVFKDS